MSVVHAFTSSEVTARAGGGLVQGDDGNFYGITSPALAFDAFNYSGQTDVAYKVTPNGDYSVIAQFGGSSGNPGLPSRTLTKGADGNFYGTTEYGGTSDYGTVFKLTPSGTVTVLASFGGPTSTTGMRPCGGLLRASNGNFYGVSQGDGSSHHDVIFKVTSTGTLTKLAVFSTTGASGVWDKLVEGPDGNYWGVAETGGATGAGCVFKVTPAGTFSTVYSFSSASGSNGHHPQGSLLLASDGNFYGTTYWRNDGTGNGGSIFKVSPTSALTFIYKFQDATGRHPSGALVQGVDGKLYGTTQFTTVENQGTTETVVFRIGTGSTLSSNDYTVLTSLDFSTAGGRSTSSLAFISSTKMLGTTAYGAENSKGAVFAVDLDPVAEIGVQSWTGANVISGSTTLAIGNAGLSTGMTKSITIRNQGTSNLSITGVSVQGGNASEFSVDTTGMTTTVTPGGSTSFTVTATPTVLGLRSTTLRILNDDTDEGTFTATITANGIPPSQFSFSARTYTLFQGATTASLIVTRTSALTAQSVTITTADGTDAVNPPFTGGTAGNNYAAFPGGSATRSFGVGVKSIVVPVTLAPKTGSQPNVRFTASLSDPTGGAALGSVASTTINILATDTTKPVVDVTTPSATDTVIDGTASPTITLQGSATDVNGIQKISIKLNTFVLEYATISDPDSGTPTVFPFSHVLIPVLGTNKLVITVYDMRNNATVVNRTFNVTGGQPFSITRSVPSSMNSRADSVGNVTVTVTPPQKATTLTPTTANALVRSCQILKGSPIKLMATPVTGYAFSHWTGLPVDATVMGNIVNFTMPEGSTAVTAVFVATPFGAPTGFGAGFAGLIYADSPENGDGYHTEAFLSGNLVTTTGGFTGSLLFEGASIPVNGTFFGDGSCVFGSGTNASHFVSLGSGRYLNLVYDPSLKTIINATIGRFVSSIPGDPPVFTSYCEGMVRRAKYSTTNLVRSALLNQTTKGFYTVTLPPSYNDGKDIHTFPQGNGYGSVTLTNSGSVTFSGVLADGVSFTATTMMVGNDEAPFLARLTVGGTTTGVFDGTLTFDRSPADSDVTCSDGFWIRPATSSGIYSSGWATGIEVDAKGALYDTTANAQTSLGLGVADSQLGNAELQFSFGKLTPSLINGQPDVDVTGFNISGNTVSMLSSVTNVFTMTLTPTTGLFTGTFTPNWNNRSTTKPTFKGVLLQKGSFKGGYGYFISNAVGDTHPESGYVNLK